MNKRASTQNAFAFSLLSLLATALPIPGHTEAKITPYGFIKAEGQYNTKNTGQRPSPSITSIPWNTNLPAQHDQLILDARRARFGFKVTDAWKDGTKFLGVIEADFYTDDSDALTTNPRHLRFRLGYAQFTLPSGFFLVGGQQRSLMQNVGLAEPEKLDDSGPVGSSSQRQPQFRLGYTRTSECGVPVTFEIDAEKQSMVSLPTSVIDSDDNTATKQECAQKLPLVAAKVSFKPSWFQTEFAGAVSKSYAIPTSTGTEIDTFVWGLHNASSLKVEPITVFYRLYYLSGLSRLVRPRLTDCVIVNGQLKPVQALGGYAGITYDVNKFLSINIFGGWAQERKVPGSALEPGSGTNRIYIAKSGYVNFIYKFWTKWKAGLEYQYDHLLSYDRVNGTGVPVIGTVNIIHTALWYYF